MHSNNKYKIHWKILPKKERRMPKKKIVVKKYVGKCRVKKCILTTRRYKRKLQKVNIFFFSFLCIYYLNSNWQQVFHVITIHRCALQRESTLNLHFYNLPNILSLNGIFGFLKKCKCFHFTILFFFSACRRHIWLWWSWSKRP